MHCGDGSEGGWKGKGGRVGEGNGGAKAEELGLRSQECFYGGRASDLAREHPLDAGQDLQPSHLIDPFTVWGFTYRGCLWS